MIVTYPNYLDQTQAIELPNILEYHGSAIPPEYIRRLTIENQKPSYRLVAEQPKPTFRLVTENEKPTYRLTVEAQ